MRPPLPNWDRWVAVPLFGYDPCFASRFRAETVHAQGMRGAGNVVAEVLWPIGDLGPFVRLIGGDVGPIWRQFAQIANTCSCGRSDCEHRRLTEMAIQRGLRDNSALAELPYVADREFSIRGHQIRFRANAPVPSDCAPREVILMGGRAGWSLIVRTAGETSSVVTSQTHCSCGHATCLHRLFVAWALRAYPDLIDGLTPRPRARQSAA